MKPTDFGWEDENGELHWDLKKKRSRLPWWKDHWFLLFLVLTAAFVLFYVLAVDSNPPHDGEPDWRDYESPHERDNF